MNSTRFNALWASSIAVGILVASLSPHSNRASAQLPSDDLRFDQSAGINTSGLGRRGAPRGRQGAGTRGDCPALPAGADLTALVPEVALEGQTIPLGLTTLERPTFWFYIPYQADALNSVQLVVLDETETPIAAPFPVSDRTTPGLVGVQLPESAPLSLGQYYRWYLLVDCQPAGSSDIFVEGFIQRVEASPELASELINASPEARVRLYARNGIWYDALTELHRSRQAAPTDPSLNAGWTELLESVGLRDLED